MTSTTAKTEPLGIGHVLQTPHTLGAILDLARRPGTHGRTVAAFIERWAAEAGTARDALLTAPAEDLAALIRGEIGFPDDCESCHTPLPGWVESLKDDHDLTWCPTCAMQSQAAQPENWRQWMQDRLDDIDGHDL